MRSGPVAVLTGAGLSTASGIPAYRDATGQWRHTTPVMHQEFLQSEARRRRYWARSFVGWQVLGAAAPNSGHQALAALQRQGWVNTIITQNVDGLHHQAGSSEVIEIHGNIHRVRCLACRHAYPRAEVQQWLQAHNPDYLERIAGIVPAGPDGDAHLDDGAYGQFKVPDCPACRGLLKPDVVFFGDSVPRDRVTRAMRAVEEAAGLMVVGSSLMVYSGFRFAEQAHRLGKPVMAINRGLTRADALLTLKVEGDCGAVLTDLVAALP